MSSSSLPMARRAARIPRLDLLSLRPCRAAAGAAAEEDKAHYHRCRFSYVPSPSSITAAADESSSSSSSSPLLQSSQPSMFPLFGVVDDVRRRRRPLPQEQHVQRRSFATSRQRRVALREKEQQQRRTEESGDGSTEPVAAGTDAPAPSPASSISSSSGLILPDQDPRSTLNLAPTSSTGKRTAIIRTDLGPDLDPRTLKKKVTEPPPIEPDPSGVSRADPEDLIDLGSMYDPHVHLPDRPDFAFDISRGRVGGGGTGGGSEASSSWEVGTPLGDDLIKYIGVRGPITVAEYMRRALRDPDHGYYTNKGASTSSAVEDEDEDDWDDDDWDKDDDGGGGLGTNDAVGPSKGGDRIIGPRGDFTTAPEISQVFGESILVWFLTQWNATSNPGKVRIAEIGPGKGTLLCDALRMAIKSFDDFARALSVEAGGDGVHLVELEGGMRSRQKEALEALEREVAEEGYKFEFVGDLKCDIVGGAKAGAEEEAEELSEGEMDKTAEKKKDVDGASAVTAEGDLAATKTRTIRIQWHDDHNSIRKADAVPTYVICQEVFDALPIHSFQKTEEGWRERLVDVAIKENHGDGGGATANRGGVGGGARDRYVDVESTGGGSMGNKESSSSSSSSSKKDTIKRPRLRYVLPPDTTPAVRTLLNVDRAGSMIGPNAHLDDAAVGDVLEVCPEGMILAQDLASLVEECGGAVLIVDYGGEGSADTLRGFRRHGQCHALSQPGWVDVTADVDFAALREAVNGRHDAAALRRRQQREHKSEVASSRTDGTEELANLSEGGDVGDGGNERKTAIPVADRAVAFGPVTQGAFLHAMCAADRVVKLIEDDTTTEKQAEDLCLALERLMTPEHMGERFKVLCIAKKKDGIFAPAGF